MLKTTDFCTLQVVPNSFTTFNYYSANLNSLKLKYLTLRNQWVNPSKQQKQAALSLQIKFIRFNDAPKRKIKINKKDEDSEKCVTNFPRWINKISTDF